MPGGVSKTPNDDAFRSLLGDVESKIFDRVDDETIFCPGHGKDSAVRGYWRCRGIR